MLALKLMISEKVYLPIIYILIGMAIYMIICKAIKNINNKKITKSALSNKKQTTLLNLIRSIFKYIIFIIVILAILNIYGINTNSIIASLGIAGAIIGLAFQDIVKNLLAGMSIIFDNHYMQGDYVTINGFEGEVIDLGLQTTKIKAYTGEVMIVNNSTITGVINHSMYNSILVIKFPVQNEVSTDTIDKIIAKIDKKILKLDEVNSNLDIKGVDEYGPENYLYRVEVSCKPYSYFSVRRELLKEIKTEFETNDIKISPDKIEVNLKK